MVCISPRCGICLFEFHDDEIVTVYRDQGPTVRYPPRLDEDAIDIEYSPCREYHKNHRQRPFHEMTVGCHPDCIRLLHPQTFRSCRAVTQWMFEPEFPGIRQAWLRYTAAQSMSLGIFLPIEVRHNIAQHLTRVYATVIQSAACRSPPPPSTRRFKVDLSMPFTLNYVSYEGIRYIASVERMDTPAAVPTKAKRVYVAGDHCGMTNFIVSSSDTLPVVDEAPNVLWKTYEIQEGRPQSFYLRGDGYKLRGVSHEIEAGKHIVSWPTPQHPGRFGTMRIEESDPVTGVEFWVRGDLKHMKRISYNFDGMTGISIRCDPHPGQIRIHTGDENKLAPYEGLPDFGVWVYTGFAPGERISTIWEISRGKDIQGLGIGTTTGRHIFFGPAAEYFQSDWHLVDRPDGEPSQFYVHSRPFGAIRCLAFESPLPTPSEQRQHSRPEPFERYHPSEACVASSVPLKGVTALRLCKRRVLGRLVVVGLMFFYENGPIRTAGQVRLDCLDSRMEVGPDELLWLDMVYTGCYVADVKLAAPGHQDANWPEVTWEGIMYWEFSKTQSRVYHNGRLLQKT